ncbi:MAG: alpha/beta fold hydrolase [Propionibacteriaceae bacterium]|jgi:pimeloyl-ACP methyl ester carboxylesterase|nr:alpha/beta fold hydrolase [Propionibacteriaceae bacterium]
MLCHVERLGTGPVRYVFCHGLFGRGRNWTSIARRLAPAGCLLLDLPDHGQAARSQRFSYDHLVQALAEVLEDLAGTDFTVVGHSMGGRAVMLTALAQPDLVPRLVVEDIGPAPTPVAALRQAADALSQLDLTGLESRRQASQALAQDLPDPALRAFLLSGLQPDPAGGWGWVFNLELLRRDLDQVVDWPDPGPTPPYPGPCLWLLGGASTTVSPDSAVRMAQLFPQLSPVEIAGAGHWVHAEAPDQFVEVLRRFATATPAWTAAV